MIRRSLSLAWFALLASAPAIAQLSQPTLDALLAQSPAVLQADAERRAAESQARQLESGQYETQVGTGFTRRSTDLDGDFAEWNLGVSRQVRWPEKRRLDEALARNTRQRARIRFEQVWQAEALEWARLTTDFSLAADRARLAGERTNGAQARMEAEQLRVQQGRGREIDLDRFRRDLALAEVAQGDAETAARLARLALDMRFPGASAMEQPVETVLASCVASQDASPRSLPVRLAQLERERVDLGRRRAQSDLLPDPQLGLNLFSERDGDEAGVGVTVSVPIAGAYRRAGRDAYVDLERAATAAQRVAEADAERQRLEVDMRAVDSLRRRDQARVAELAAASVISRLERGLSLQAATMLDLLEARQALWTAQLASAEAQAAFDHARLQRAVLAGCLSPSAMVPE